jgi:hypothetical protein
MRALSRVNNSGGNIGVMPQPFLKGVDGIVKTAKTLAVLGLLAALTLASQAAIPVSLAAAASVPVQTGGSNRQEVATSPLLEVRSSTRDGTSEAYLRFDLSNCVSILDSAKLRIYARLAEPGLARLIVRSVASSSWSERSITWANKPDQDVSLGEIEVVGISAAWYDLDITAFVKGEQAAGRKTVNLALVLGGAYDNKVLLNSRHAPDHQPELSGSRQPLNLKISFLPAAASPPDGFLADHGQVFGPRTKGLEYGWDIDNSTFMRDRSQPPGSAEKPLTPQDRLRQTFAYLEHAKRPKSASWELALPNSAYRVHLMAGDAQSYDSVYAIDVEDVPVVDGIPEKHRHWVEGTKEVKVRDGRLTVASNRYGSRNRINFIEITEIEPGAN